MNDGNNRKLIGTIIGVIFFVILIAGATFAWLIYSANVSNGTYNGSTLNFNVNYTSGNDITYLPMLSGDFTYQDYISAGGQVISGNAYKQNLDGILYLKLYVYDNIDNSILFSSGCIKSAVVYGANSSIDNSTVVTQLSTVNAINSFESPSSFVVVLYSGDLLPNGVPTPNFKILMWIDKEIATNSVDGLSFSGYVYATAIQSNPSDASSTSERER